MGEEVTYVLRLLLAAVLGGAVGMEREKRGRSAGLRTHILVAVGGALSSVVAVYCEKHLGFNGDMFRLPAAVISGIGFLCSGIILTRESRATRGLTSAAGLWTVAIIGLASGFGAYTLAVIATVIVLVTFAVMVRLEINGGITTGIYLELCDPKGTNRVYAEVQKLTNMRLDIKVTEPKSGTEGSIGIYLAIRGQYDLTHIEKFLTEDPAVSFYIIE